MFMAASVFCLALVILVIYRAEARIGDTWRCKNNQLRIQLQQWTSRDQKLQTVIAERSNLSTQADQMKTLEEARFQWIPIMTDLRAALMKAEAAEDHRLVTPENGGKDMAVGVWVEAFEPEIPYASRGPITGSRPSISYDSISSLSLLCRGVNRSPSANSALAECVLRYLATSPSFTNPARVWNFRQDSDTNTFTFDVSVTLRHPIKL
jgi:hypothetical protein